MNEPAKRITDGPPEESGAVSRPLRKPKHSVWLSLVVATAAYACVSALGMVISLVVSSLYLITFKPYGHGEHWLIPNVLEAAIAMCISALVYRRFRLGGRSLLPVTAKVGTPSLLPTQSLVPANILGRTPIEYPPDDLD